MTKVWDGFIRGFHWLLVLGIAVLYVTGEEGYLEAHFITGYLLLALMLARVVWGVIGSDTAKLSALFHSPKSALKAMRSDDAGVGHNPAGSYMVLLFFILIFIQLISGLMSTDDILVEGPLVAYVPSSWSEIASDLHHDNFDILLMAIALHILAIIIYRIKGKNLVKTLLTGKEQGVAAVPKMRSGKLGYIIFMLFSIAILGIWGGQPLQVLLG
ncbi:cytochrome b/b6 domain-containing protein [Pseudoalteromonas sp. MMG022]|uniref:cytochrome b/b6 domain-containing protein n=1 Tax=Pseudoalteromonas sp. MMG022 TaxID=2909978 RepID=UPI001F018B4E|nr:cytochrome b/b6 domain-containing protein [Pseudoalteromonas sp. MMG022]MCF6437325.1 cytochrome b/b6 domain-containing protein [Pseudoalteromonas sp. MMG022]